MGNGHPCLTELHDQRTPIHLGNVSLARPVDIALVVIAGYSVNGVVKAKHMYLKSEATELRAFE